MALVIGSKMGNIGSLIKRQNKQKNCQMILEPHMILQNVWLSCHERAFSEEEILHVTR